MKSHWPPNHSPQPLAPVGRFRIAWEVVLILTLGGCAALAQLDPGNPLSGLEKLKNFETRRTSSTDPDWRHGNGDCRWIKPGGSLTLAELAGPGEIVHFWCTIADQEPNYSRLLTLRIYWDGETNASVECPIGDFFGMGMGVDKPFTSLPVRVSSDGRGRNCYWPMPFRKSARIVVTNEGKRPCDAFYYYIDWQKLPSLPKDTRLFPRDVPAGVSVRDGPELSDCGHHGSRALRGHRVERLSDIAGLVWRRRRFLLHRRREGAQPARNRNGRLFLRRLGFSRAIRPVLWHPAVGRLRHRRSRQRLPLAYSRSGHLQEIVARGNPTQGQPGFSRWKIHRFH